MEKLYECCVCGKIFTKFDEEQEVNEGYEADPEHEKCPFCYTYDLDLERG